MVNENITHDNYQSKYLDDEHPILIRVPVARALNSDRQAYFLQQVRYWINTNKKKPRNQHYFQDGRWWMYNTLNEWHEQFPWLSKMTIRRIIEALKDKGLLITGNYNKKKYDKTVWYSIDERKLDEIIGEHMSVCSKRTQGCVQKEHMDVVKKNTPIPEITSEIKAEEARDHSAASLNNEKAAAIVNVYIEKLKENSLVPVHKKEKLIQQFNKSPLAAIESDHVINKLRSWFSDADNQTVKQGYPFGYFIKDYNTIEVGRIDAGLCEYCEKRLYEGVRHSCHRAYCDQCNTAIGYNGHKRDAEILAVHECKTLENLLDEDERQYQEQKHARLQ